MTDEERQLLLDTRFDTDTWPKSKPRRGRGMRMRNKSHRQLQAQRTSSTELQALKRVHRSALRYSTQSEEW